MKALKISQPFAVQFARAVLAMLLVLSLLPVGAAKAIAETSVGMGQVDESAAAPDSAETGSEPVLDGVATSEETLAPEPMPEATAESPSTDVASVEGTDAAVAVERRLDIRELTEGQASALGGLERLEREFIVFLELEYLGSVTVATAEDYDGALAARITVAFALNDAAVTKVVLEYDGAGGYNFAVISDLGIHPVEDDLATESGTDVNGSVSFVPMNYSLLAAPPANITGRFTIAPWFGCDDQYRGDFPGFLHSFGNLDIHSFGNNHDGDNSRLSCISSGAANWGDNSNGNNRSGTVYATHWWDDHANGVSWYTVDRVVPDIQPAPPGTISGVQYLGSGVIGIKWRFDSWISIDKHVLGLDMVRNNPNYSLDGIIYDAYASWGDADARQNSIGFIRLNQSVYDGVPYAWGSLRVTRPGTYYLRERGGGIGYQIDQTIHAVRAGEPFDGYDGDTGVNVIKLYDKPMGDPMGIIVQKLDAITGKAWGTHDPQGLSLAGAQFTVRYYNNYYDTVNDAETSGAPTRTWVVKTGASGVAALADSYLVSGSDPLYYSEHGTPTLPLGTILIQETFAPPGYLLPSPNSVDLQQIRLNTSLDAVVRLNPVTVLEQPHQLRIKKSDIATGDSLPGAEFALYKESTAGAGDWTELIRFVTGADGGFEMSPVNVGSYKLVETVAPPGYMLPSQAGQPKEIAFIIDELTQIKTIEVKDYAKSTIPVRKLDRDSKLPIPDTEFTLYSYPVELNNGTISSDTAAVTVDDPAWEQVAVLVSDSLGRVYFDGLPYGYYKLVETRPNSAYATHQESGGEPHFVKIDKYATGEVQIFEDMVIQISCEVYKKTIAITSSGLDGTDVGAVNNVGHEEYLYRFGARSTSNVWADEFIVTDDLSYVTSLGYLMTTLWTGTSPAGMDFDNKMAVLYKTNMTAATEPVLFSYNPLSGNPDNPNNPGRNIIYSNAPGWRIWAEQLSTTNQTRLDVSELNLADGEYIVGLKVAYGGVVKDFFTGTGWLTEDDPHTVPPLDMRPMQTTSNESVLADWYYSVIASGSLLPIDEMGDETVMRGSVSADINRNNGALEDHDEDRVETRVIEPFEMPTVSNGLVVPPLPTRQISAPGRRLPQTGDSYTSLALMTILALAGTSLLGAGMLRRRRLRR